MARSTAIAGFVATSNVDAARALGLRAAGTMAHSYIEAFGSEIEAFRAFAQDFPDRVVILVDTYDTPRGVKKAIEVAREVRAGGKQISGIRLDSGDLGALAVEAREALDAAGLQEVGIFASGGLDEHALAELAATPIDAFGVGSKVGVAADGPFLDSVYKLVEYDARPVAKLSTDKETLPGPKQVWRRPSGDVIGLRAEGGPEGGEPLLVPAMSGGRRRSDEGWEEARERCLAELEALPDDLRRLDAAPPSAARSPALTALVEEVRATIRERELGG